MKPMSRKQPRINWRRRRRTSAERKTSSGSFWRSEGTTEMLLTTATMTANPRRCLISCRTLWQTCCGYSTTTKPSQQQQQFLTRRSTAHADQITHQFGQRKKHPRSNQSIKTRDHTATPMNSQFQSNLYLPINKYIHNHTHIYTAIDFSLRLKMK